MKRLLCRSSMSAKDTTTSIKTLLMRTKCIDLMYILSSFLGFVFALLIETDDPNNSFLEILTISIDAALKYYIDRYRIIYIKHHYYLEP